jgi:hypothetical protein
MVSEELLSSLEFLQAARILQNTGQTLTVAVERGGPVKVSFFGSLSIGRVGTPDTTPDRVLSVASLLDLAGTKAKVVLQRAESKDYLDLLALFQGGVNLSQALAAARALYGDQYNPMLTVKSLTYFEDGDLYKLTTSERNRLSLIACRQEFDLPMIPRLSEELSAS